MKKDIEQALKNFSTKGLFDACIGLFSTLGYNTSRRSRLTDTSAKGFINEFARDNYNLRESKILEKSGFTKETQKIELLFQLTDIEMKNDSNLFDKGRVDNKIIEAYLFFGIELKEREYSRTMLAGITRAINRVFPMPVMIIFRYGENITISSIDRRLHKKDESRDVLEKVTLIKDINTVQPNRGHIEILFDLSLVELRKNNTITNFVELHNAWHKILDIKELNKRFYMDISNWYFWAKTLVKFPDDIIRDQEERNSKNLIRLLTRIIFVWFMKEKGLIPEELFDENFIKEIIKYNDTNADFAHSEYYRAILQNLFFGTLNRKPNTKEKPDNRRFREAGAKEHGIKMFYRYAEYFKDSGSEKLLELFNTIPFLNGGLFDCLDKEDDDNVMQYIDGFSSNFLHSARVPNQLFFSEESVIDLREVYGDKKYNQVKVRGLINILKSYKFTVAENTPVEEEIALDPELLGRVFENLLAVYNPETSQSARKSTGSFYTPREIVNYMVDESLIAYLTQKFIENKEYIENFKRANPGKNPDLFGNKEVEQLKLPEDAFFLKDKEKEEIEIKMRDLIAYADDINPFDEVESKILIQAIDRAKILDPACGSGAFPMGMLQKMVYILHKIDPENQNWKKRQLEKAKRIDDPQARELAISAINYAFENHNLDYGRKLFLIENCIYGVDIQAIAVQISKLRFFISLLIEQDEKNDKPEENFGIKPLPNLETKFVIANTLIGIERPDGVLPNLEITAKEEELLKNHHRHFNANTRAEKLFIQSENKKLRKEISKLLINNGWNNKSAEQIANWDPFDPNSRADWFDPEWMFGVMDGFDVVIGNPPYIQIQKFSGQDIQKQWKEQNFQSFERTGDIYTLFYEKGNLLLRENGHLIFITSNKWMRANYGKSLRKYLKKNTTPKKLIDFGGYKVFESATVDTNILLFQKGKNENKTLACKIEKDFKNNTNISEYVNKNRVILNNLSENSWIILTKEEARIKEKIEKIGTPLRDWDISINYGIKTGYNEAFIIDGDKKNELIKADPKNAEIIKPILRGRDIKRYKAEFADLWLIATFPALHININNYPVIRDYLKTFGKRLKQSGEKGCRKKTNNKWFEVQDTIAYYEEFEKEKIVWASVGETYFTFVEKNVLLLDTNYFCVFKTHKISKYILALLNSKILVNYLNSKDTKVGTIAYRHYKYNFEEITIPKISRKQQLPFEILVDCILFAKENNLEIEANTFESVIDGMVYDLYFEEDMKKAECYITNRIAEVIKPFKESDTDEFKLEYIKKLYRFCIEDKIVQRGLIHRRNIKVVKIISGVME